MRAKVVLGAVMFSGVAAAATVVAAATDRWVEVRTANVAVISNAKLDVAQELAVQLEQARTALRYVVGAVVTEPGEPVVVLAVHGEKALKELLPQFWERRGARPAAAASPGPYTPYIALRTDVADDLRQRLLLHEYVHILTRGNIPNVPAWLDEGLSEFWGTLQVRDGVAHVGGAPANHIKVLRSRDWIPLPELLAIERGRYPSERGEVEMLYAQSWALTQYLLLKSPVLSARLPYAPELPGDLTGLEGELRDYLRSGQFTVRAFPLSPGPQAPGPSSRTLPISESLAVRANFLVHGERPRAALPLLRSALALNPGEPLALEGLGTFHFLMNEPDQARTWLRKAIDAGYASYRVHYYYAVLMSADPATAHLHLKRALELNPGFRPALDRLLSTPGPQP